MSTSGETADQVVRMTLGGVEVAAKLSGAAAKQVAVMLYAILKDQKRTKGKIRLSSMLRSGNGCGFTAKELRKCNQDVSLHHSGCRESRRECCGGQEHLCL